MCRYPRLISMVGDQKKVLVKIPAILSNINLFNLQKRSVYKCSISSNEESWKSNLRIETVCHGIKQIIVRFLVN